MAKIVPFRGLRYNPEKLENPAAVMAPPYDAISPEEQESLYQASPFNIVRLILAKTSAGDVPGDDRYSRAAADFQAWQEEEVLVRDPEPSLYLYDQSYVGMDGQELVRRGIIALARVEELSSGVVKAHEKTLSGPKTDRMRLTLACGANFSPIFALYGDPCCALESLTHKVRDNRPDLEVPDQDGNKHRLWRVADESAIHKAQELLGKKPLFIADGHHRYETALAYRNLMREKHPDFSGKELFNFVLMYFSNTEDRGLTLRPIHRLVANLPGFELPSVLKALTAFFQVDRYEVLMEGDSPAENVLKILRGKGANSRTLGLYGGGDQVFLLSLKDPKVMDRFFDEKASKVLKTLDVSILHRLIFEHLLGIAPEAQDQQTHLRYLEYPDRAMAKVRGGEAQMAFLMNPTSLSEVRDVANSGEKMPPKSSFFYPQLLTGLVINKIVEGERAGE